MGGCLCGHLVSFKDWVRRSLDPTGLVGLVQRLHSTFGILLVHKEGFQGPLEELSDLYQQYNYASLGSCSERELAEFTRFTLDEIQEVQDAYNDLVRQNFRGQALACRLLSRSGISESVTRMVVGRLLPQEEVVFSTLLSIVSVFERGTAADKIAFVFAMFDYDGNGRLSYSEVVDVMDSIAGDSCTEAEVDRLVDELMEELDSNGDGDVTFEEFVAAYPLVDSLLCLSQPVHGRCASIAPAAASRRLTRAAEQPRAPELVVSDEDEPRGPREDRPSVVADAVVAMQQHGRWSATESTNESGHSAGVDEEPAASEPPTSPAAVAVLSPRTDPSARLQTGKDGTLDVRALTTVVAPPSPGKLGAVSNLRRHMLTPGERARFADARDAARGEAVMGGGAEVCGGSARLAAALVTHAVGREDVRLYDDDDDAVGSSAAAGDGGDGGGCGSGGGTAVLAAVMVKAQLVKKRGACQLQLEPPPEEEDSDTSDSHDSAATSVSRSLRGSTHVSNYAVDSIGSSAGSPRLEPLHSPKVRGLLDADMSTLCSLDTPLVREDSAIIDVVSSPLSSRGRSPRRRHEARFSTHSKSDLSLDGTMRIESEQ